MIKRFLAALLDSRKQLRFIRAFLFYIGTFCLICCFGNFWLLPLALACYAGIALVNSQIKDEEEENNN